MVRESQQLTSQEQNLLQEDDNQSSNGTEANVTQTSSSMRKHLDYIYKRNLRTSRREEPSQISSIDNETDKPVPPVDDALLNHQLPLQQQTNNQTMLNSSNLDQQSKLLSSSSLSTTTLLHTRQPSTDFIHRSTDGGDPTGANTMTLSVRNNPPSYISSNQVTIVMPGLAATEKQFAAENIEDGGSSTSMILADEGGQNTSRLSRRSYSGSNTKLLFKKRDKSQQSEDGAQSSSSILAVTPRTVTAELPRAANFPLMTNEDVILHEHLTLAVRQSAVDQEQDTISTQKLSV